MSHSRFVVLSFLLFLTACSAAPGERRRDAVKLIDPGTLGANGAADVRRDLFNYLNEQAIHSDVPVSTVFLGDSITELWNVELDFKPPGRSVVQNRGISGDLAQTMAKRFEADVLQLHPRNVVILGGTNEVHDDFMKDKTDAQIIEAVRQSMHQMIDAAQQKKISVLICSILPTNKDFPMHEQRPRLRKKLNAALKEICKEKNCVYVDYASAVADQNGDLRNDLAYDGIHPHYAGYKIMAATLKQAAAENRIKL